MNTRGHSDCVTSPLGAMHSEQFLVCPPLFCLHPLQQQKHVCEVTPNASGGQLSLRQVPGGLGMLHTRLPVGSHPRVVPPRFELPWLTFSVSLHRAHLWLRGCKVRRIIVTFGCVGQTLDFVANFEFLEQSFAFFGGKL